MSRLRILYLGAHDGTSLDRANAYRRLGHGVLHIDPRKLLPRSVWIDRIAWRCGGHLFGPPIARRLRALLDRREFDVCHVDNGEWVTPGVLGVIRRHAGKVLNYSIDDPLGPRDGRRFQAYRLALPHYDLAVVVRQENVAEARAAGARAVLRVFRSADEATHAPRPLSAEDRRRWDSEVLFLGTWMPERGPFLLALAQAGVPLTIRGSNWHKAPQWPALQRFWKGGAIAGDDYARAIQCARVNLGLLSKGNRDLHTTRSLEIPAVGGLLCAERNDEHRSMYREGEEAVFWDTPAECIAACRALLRDDAMRLRIAVNGRARLLRNGHCNEPVMARILAAGETLSAADRHG